MLPARSGSCFLSELIDTLWNVNFIKVNPKNPMQQN